jgi:hypothetical protein
MGRRVFLSKMDAATQALPLQLLREPSGIGGRNRLRDGCPQYCTLRRALRTATHGEPRDRPGRRTSTLHPSCRFPEFLVRRTGKVGFRGSTDRRPATSIPRADFSVGARLWFERDSTWRLLRNDKSRRECTSNLGIRTHTHREIAEGRHELPRRPLSFCLRGGQPPFCPGGRVQMTITPQL